MVTIIPSILAADFTRLGEQVEAVQAAGLQAVSVDIMDGYFVPNLTFGPGIVKAIHNRTGIFLDVHLMMVEPERYLEAFRDAGADILTVHIEASRHLQRTVEEIKRLGMKAGVSLNPHTTVSSLECIIRDLDLVLIMSVNPGFGGQQYIPASTDKIRELRQLIGETDSQALIEVDGGIDENNAGMIFDAGANVLVAGTTVFHSDDPVAMIRRLKDAGR